MCASASRAWWSSQGLVSPLPGFFDPGELALDFEHRSQLAYAQCCLLWISGPSPAWVTPECWQGASTARPLGLGGAAVCHSVPGPLSGAGGEGHLGLWAQEDSLLCPGHLSPLGPLPSPSGTVRIQNCHVFSQHVLVHARLPWGRRRAPFAP